MHGSASATKPGTSMRVIHQARATVTVAINCYNLNGSCNYLKHTPECVLAGGGAGVILRQMKSLFLAPSLIFEFLSPFNIFVQLNKMRLSFYYLQGPCHTISKN